MYKNSYQHLKTRLSQTLMMEISLQIIRVKVRHLMIEKSGKELKHYSNTWRIKVQKCHISMCSLFILSNKVACLAVCLTQIQFTKWALSDFTTGTWNLQTIACLMSTSC